MTLTSRFIFAVLFVAFIGPPVPSSGQNHKSNPLCRRKFTRSSGAVAYGVSPEQPDDERFCNFDIQVEQDKRVHLQFLITHLKSDNNAYVDFVLLFDGADCMSPRIGVAHDNITGSYNSSRNQMTALFLANTENETVGFWSAYSAASVPKSKKAKAKAKDMILTNCGEERNDSSGNISHHGKNTDNALCIWRITAPQGMAVKLQIKNLTMYSEFSSFRILDGNTCGANILASYRRYDPVNIIFTSSSNTIIVVFSVPIGMESEAFEASYSHVTPPSTTKPSAMTTTTTSPYIPSPLCRRTLSGQESGTIMYGVFPPQPDVDRFCNFAINTTSAKKIELKFLLIYLKSQDGALLDFVLIFDGPDCMSRRIGLGHDYNRTTVVSSGSRMNALLISNTQDEQVGFWSEYKTVNGTSKEAESEVLSPDQALVLENCGMDLDGVSGGFSYQGKGSKNALCIWRITVEAGKTITLEVKELELKSNWSTVRVLDGRSCLGRDLLFIRGPGKVEPRPVTSTSNAMIVVLSSPTGSSSERLEASYFRDDYSTTTTPGFGSYLQPCRKAIAALFLLSIHHLAF